jgi:hypothetical protein
MIFSPYKIWGSHRWCWRFWSSWTLLFVSFGKYLLVSKCRTAFFCRVSISLAPQMEALRFFDSLKIFTCRHGVTIHKTWTVDSGYYCQSWIVIYDFSRLP